jgi:large subunit ribosomal protein L5
MAKQQAAEKAPAGPAAKATGPARLQQIYREKIVPELVAKFGYVSTMQVPRLEKITLNMGVSEAVSDKKVMEHAVGDLTKIAGQKPVVTKSKKAIAGFKIRDGVPIGCMVTLRGVRMYEFLDRFVTVACRGCATSAASRGVRSTAVATTTSASRNRSSFPRSSTTRSTRSVD